MRLRHFFENMVRREEMASAFLATLLDYDPAFRQAFLGLALDDPAIEDHEAWIVRVEGERSHTTRTDLNVPARLPLAIEVTGVERWSQRSTG